MNLDQGLKDPILQIAKIAAAMTRVGDCTFLALNTIDGVRNFKEICVDLVRTTAVVAIHPSPRVQAIGDVDTENIGATAVSLVSVARSSLRESRGADWTSVIALSPWPTKASTVDMFNTLRGVVTVASSIEAVGVPERRQSTFAQSSGSMEFPGAPSSAPPGSNAGLMGLLGNASNMLRRPTVPPSGMSENGQDSSLEDDAEDDVQEEFVRPGAPKEKARKRPDVAPRADGLFESFA